MTRFKAHSPFSVLILSLIVFLVGDTLIFRSGLYPHYLDQRGRNIAGFQHSIDKMHAYNPDGKQAGILLLGSSEFRWPTDHQLIQDHAPVRPEMIMPDNTNEESWYHLLKLGDPQKNKYKLVIVGLPRYRISPEYDISRDLSNAQQLANIVSWKDYIQIVNNYPDLGTKFQALEFKLFPSSIYADEILFSIFKVFTQKKSSDPQFRHQRFLDNHHGTWRDVIVDKQNHLVECRPPQDLHSCVAIADYKNPLPAEIASEHTSRNFVFEKKWVQNIIDYYQGTYTKLVFIELPSAPGVTKGSPIAQAPDIRNNVHLNPNVKFLPESELNKFSAAEFMTDQYHLSPVAVNPAFTQKVLQIISTNFYK